MSFSAALASTEPTSQQKRGSRGSINSRQFIKNYDKSPLTSPIHSPTTTPPLSRKNSSSSVNSIQSEPTWSSGRHQSEPALRSAKPRQDSNSSQASAQTTASRRKGSFMGGLFSRSDKAEKEKKKKDNEKIVLTSRHAAAVKTRMMLDPQYREFQEKHQAPQVKTAGITGYTPSAHSSAASQEARHPHSGPPTLHGSLDLPALSRIESHDEADDEIDPFQRTRLEWNEAHETNMAEIPELRSRQNSARASPWGSPVHSRDSSPNRYSARPSVGSKRNSYAGGYHKDANGRWTKKPTSVAPVHPNHGGVNADLLAASLAERLDAAA